MYALFFTFVSGYDSFFLNFYQVDKGKLSMCTTNFQDLKRSVLL